MSSNYLWTNFIAFIAITVFLYLMLWTNSALTHLHYIFVTYTRCVFMLLIIHYNKQFESTSVLNIVESQYFSQYIEKVVITIIVRMSQYRYTVVFSYHIISNETYIRLLGSPVPVNKSVSQLLEHLTRSRFSELRFEFW